MTPSSIPTPSSLPVQDTGPYLVTVLEPCAPCDESGELWIQDEPELCSRETCERCAGEGARVVSRRAFVTLDEAPGFDDEAGGGRHTLPDGTVIEVEKTTWRALADAVDFDPHRLYEASEILDVFNAPASQENGGAR